MMLTHNSKNVGSFFTKAKKQAPRLRTRNKVLLSIHQIQHVNQHQRGHQPIMASIMTKLGWQSHINPRISSSYFSTQCDKRLLQEEEEETDSAMGGHSGQGDDQFSHYHHQNHHHSLLPLKQKQLAKRQRENEHEHEHEYGQDWLFGPRDDSWFTGVPPRSCPGFIQGTSSDMDNTETAQEGTLTSLPLPQFPQQHPKNKNQQSSHLTSLLQDYFDNTWTLYELLFSSLNGPQGFYKVAPHGLRHPQIFYYGHSAVLYIHKLRAAHLLHDQDEDNHEGLGRPAKADYYEAIFEVGVDEMTWDDMTKNDMVWPTVEEVHQYRRYVYDTVSQVIRRVQQQQQQQQQVSSDGTQTDGYLSDNHALWALLMGMEHERIHFETSSVLIRELEPTSLVQTPQFWPPLHPSSSVTNTTTDRNGRRRVSATQPEQGKHYPSNPMITAAHTTQRIRLGKSRDVPTFGWDNEFGTRTVQVPPFAASQFMVTNGEYWHFVRDEQHGYSQPDHWCEEGWAWRCHRQMKHPYFWKEPSKNGGANSYQLRTLFKEIDMPWDWPVDVNYYEAKAYCRWKSSQQQRHAPENKNNSAAPYRLLTEAEHHVLRGNETESTNKNDPVLYKSGQDFRKSANLNLAHGSQNDVGAFPPSPTGHYDVMGNAWEWMEDHFNPLRGDNQGGNNDIEDNDAFAIHPLYPDFSTPCFDGHHQMIMGGSFISTGDEASTYARFHFRPHFLQHSGFRLVQSLSSNDTVPAKHLTEEEASQAASSVVTISRNPNDVAPPVNKTVSAKDSFNDSDNVYETKQSLDMYLGLHYPRSGEAENLPPILPHDNAPRHGLFFPQRVAQLLKRLVKEHSGTSSKALDVGCAVGGASFELAKSFDRVDAFDYSSTFVQAALGMQLQQEGAATTFSVPIEGDIHQKVKAIHDNDVDSSVRSKVKFFEGNACEMEVMQESGALADSYDGILISNLLCRLPDPMACLASLPRLMTKGGVVVLVTPFTWLEEFTSRDEWLGGFYIDNDSGAATEEERRPVWSKDTLRSVMETNGFEKIHEENIPLVIREHARKYQYVVSEASGWRKIQE